MTLTGLMLVTQAISVAAIVGVWRGRGTLAITVIAAAAILVLHGYVYWDNVFDDAFISFRYAHNLAHGNGLVWNPGERVEGYSNFLWVLLLASTEWVGLGIVEPSRWLGFIACGGVLLILNRFAHELSDDRRRAELTFAGTALLLAATAPIAIWTFGGLEEMLFTFFVALALYAHVREERTRGIPYASALAIFGGAITRPEGLLVGAVVLVLKAVPALADVRGVEGPVLARFARSTRCRGLAVWCAVLAVPYAAFIAWRLAYYGQLMPNTYYQKLGGQSTFDMDRYHMGYVYVRSFWQQYGMFLVFPLPYLAFLSRRTWAVAIPLLSFVTAWMAYVIYAGGDFEAFFRFLVPVLPFTYLLSVDSVISVARRLEGRAARRAAGALLSASLLLTSAWLMHVSPEAVNGIRFWRIVADQRTEEAAWIRAQDPTAVIAVEAAGQLPYWSGNPAIDTLGLMDRHIAHQPPYPKTLGFDVPGHRKGDASYVLKRRPDMIIVNFGTMTFLPVSVHQWKTSNPSLAADQDLLRQPDLWDLYEAAWVRLPSGVFNFLRLKSSMKIYAQAAPELNSAELGLVQAKDLPGSCDNWVLPRPPVTSDYGIFYLTDTVTASGPPRRAVTKYRTDTPGSPLKVVELYRQYMEQSHWDFAGLEHGELADVPGVPFTIESFKTGQGPGASGAFVAISDDGTTLVTSTDYGPNDTPSSFYRCLRR